MMLQRIIKITALSMNVILFAFMMLFLQTVHGADFYIGCVLATTPILSLITIFKMKGLTLCKLERDVAILRAKAEIKELEAKIADDEGRD
jgi:hypothetical protein